MSDPELTAMGKVLDALSELDLPTRTRVIRWINEKLELLPLMDKVKEHDARVSNDFRQTRGDEGAPHEKFEKSLATYIREKGADGNQTQRFLVTADWLRRRGQQLSSGSVAKALTDNHQSRVSNPADCLNKNVAKGLCEKLKDGGFFITPEGLKELGSQ